MFTETHCPTQMRKEISNLTHLFSFFFFPISRFALHDRSDESTKQHKAVPCMASLSSSCLLGQRRRLLSPIWSEQATLLQDEATGWRKRATSALQHAGI